MTRTLRLPIFAIAASVGAAAYLAAAFAQAQMVQPVQMACGARDSFLAQLDAKYGETRRSMGLSDNSVVELFANEATGSWTILITSPQGIACILAAGEAFQIDAAELTTTGDPV